MMLNDFEIFGITDYLLYTDPLKNDQQLYFLEKKEFIEVKDEKSILRDFLFSEII